MIHEGSWSNKVFGNLSAKPHYAVLHQHKSASCPPAAVLTLVMRDIFGIL